MSQKFLIKKLLFLIDFLHSVKSTKLLLRFNTLVTCLRHHHFDFSPFRHFVAFRIFQENYSL